MAETSEDTHEQMSLFGSIGDIPPTEAEANHYAALRAMPMAA